MAAKLALLDYIRKARDPWVAGVALDALKDEKDENEIPYLAEDEEDDTVPGLVDAVLTFLGGPACLLETPGTLTPLTGCLPRSRSNNSGPRTLAPSLSPAPCNSLQHSGFWSGRRIRAPSHTWPEQSYGRIRPTPRTETLFSRRV